MQSRLNSSWATALRASRTPLVAASASRSATAGTPCSATRPESLSISNTHDAEASQQQRVQQPRMQAAVRVRQTPLRTTASQMACRQVVPLATVTREVEEEQRNEENFRRWSPIQLDPNVDDLLQRTLRGPIDYTLPHPEEARRLTRKRNYYEPGPRQVDDENYVQGYGSGVLQSAKMPRLKREGSPFNEGIEGPAPGTAVSTQQPERSESNQRNYNTPLDLMHMTVQQYQQRKVREEVLSALHGSATAPHTPLTSTSRQPKEPIHLSPTQPGPDSPTLSTSPSSPGHPEEARQAWRSLQEDSRESDLFRTPLVSRQQGYASRGTKLVTPRVAATPGQYKYNLPRGEAPRYLGGSGYNLNTTQEWSSSPPVTPQNRPSPERSQTPEVSRAYRTRPRQAYSAPHAPPSPEAPRELQRTPNQPIPSPDQESGSTSRYSWLHDDQDTNPPLRPVQAPHPQSAAPLAVASRSRRPVTSFTLPGTAKEYFSANSGMRIEGVSYRRAPRATTSHLPEPVSMRVPAGAAAAQRRRTLGPALQGRRTQQQLRFNPKL